jgi:hypothetical protein
LGAKGFQGIQNFVTFNDLSKDGVVTIQPRSLVKSDEELRAVGVLKLYINKPFSTPPNPYTYRTSISHGQDTLSSVLQSKILTINQEKRVKINASIYSMITLTH